jgi:hypothetical protein
VTPNYWVFKVKEEAGGLYRRAGAELYGHRMQDCFWSFKEDPETGKLALDVEQLEKGDRVIFYFVEPNRESRFLGTAVLDSAFEKLEPQKAKRVVHKEFLDGDQGVFLTEINKWIKPLPVELLKGKGAFGDGRPKFGQFFKGNIKKLNGLEEYETILHEYQEMLGLSAMTKKKKKHPFAQKSKKRFNEK